MTRTPLVVVVLFVTVLTWTPGAQQVAVPRVGLNHVYAVVDDETAEAIKTSHALNEFAYFTVQTIVPGDGRKWTGRYLTGKETYLELFALADLKESGEPGVRGLTVIALGIDRVGGLESLGARLKLSGVSARTTMEKVRRGDMDVDWFKLLEIHSAGPFGIFAMEYAEPFFRFVRNKEAAEGRDDVVSRERFNEDEYRNRQMRDISGVEVGVERDRYKTHEPMLQAAGFRLRESGSRLIAEGPDVNLQFVFVGPESIGLRKVDFVLNRSVKERKIETIGNSTLTIGPGTRASWVFNRK